MACSGDGASHSWPVAHHAFHPAFAPELPYILVTVDLVEGVRALGRWRGDPVLAPGLRVHGGFEARADGVDLVFEPQPDGGGRRGGSKVAQPAAAP